MKKSLRLTLKLILTAIIILGLDKYFFSSIPLFSRAIKNIQNKPLELRWYSVVIAYIILITGLFYFVIMPNKSVAEGAFFGTVMYGVFDFTNHAIFKKYNLSLAIIDITWGTVLCAITTFIVKALLPN